MLAVAEGQNTGDVTSATLLVPFETQGLRFKNRMVHVPTTMNLSDPLGHVTDRLIGVYETIAAGGSSATIVGATCVRRDGLINERMLGMYDDNYVIGFRDVVDVIKHNDSLAGLQLFYGGLIPGLGTTVPLEGPNGWIPDTVSWGPSDKYPIGNPAPRVLTTKDYEDVVEAYGQAARRTREAGFDFVSYHFCHGSLPHTNLSLLSNQGRTDKYADHFLLVEEILQRTQELCGKDFPVIPRICCDENLEGGFDIEYFAEHYAPRLHALGIAVLDCTFGSMLGAPSRRAEIHSTEFIGPVFYTPHVVNRDNIRTLREELVKRDVEMPLIGSANLGSPEQMQQMLDAGAEFAGVCRLSMDDPDYANKIERGQEHLIRKSTRTGASLLQGNIFGKGWAGSAQNASFGRDREYRLVPPVKNKKVVVVGAGSGGLEYALTAHERGHEVLVLERSQTLGGAMDWVGNYPNVPNMEIIRYQADYHRNMVEHVGVPYRLGVEASVKTVLAEDPDVVVIATGATFDVPDVEGAAAAVERAFVTTIAGALSRETLFEPGPAPVVYGAGVGAEIAIDYALRQLPVRLIDPNPAGYVPANYIGSRAMHIQGFLAKIGLEVEGGKTLARIDGDAVVFATEDGGEETVAASSLIVATGRRPNDGLVAEFRGRGVVVEVVGDARVPRSYGNAIHEAAYLSRRV